MTFGIDNTFVIIGGGLAAGKAVESLRSEGFGGELVVIAEEDVLPYERPPLSKGVLLGTEDADVPVLHDQAWYTQQRVDVRTATRAERLDTAGHVVALSDGSSVRYDRLLLATGARVRRLEVPGSDLEGVVYLRTLPECLALLDFAAG